MRMPFQLGNEKGRTFKKTLTACMGKKYKFLGPDCRVGESLQDL